MEKYRKKPVVIEAMRWNGVVGEAMAFISEAFSIGDGPEPSLFIPTLEGEMEARFGDWVIRGVQGEFYPCKPDIFDATYEPA